MVGTLDRTTPRGKRDAATMIVDWWMAGRASESARLNLHDVAIIMVKVEDDTGNKVLRKALVPAAPDYVSQRNRGPETW